MTSILPTKNTRIFAYLLVILLLALPLMSSAEHPFRLGEPYDCHIGVDCPEDGGQITQNNEVEQADEDEISALKALILKLQVTLVSLLQQLILMLQSSTPAEPTPTPTPEPEPAPSDPGTTPPDPEPTEPDFTRISLSDLPTTAVIQNRDGIYVGSANVRVDSIEVVCPAEGYAAPCLDTATISVDNTPGEAKTLTYNLTTGSSADTDYGFSMKAKAIDTTTGNQSVVLYLEDL